VVGDLGKGFETGKDLFGSRPPSLDESILRQVRLVVECRCYTWMSSTIMEMYYARNLESSPFGDATYTVDST
jgi:hypothetical protein